MQAIRRFLHITRLWILALPLAVSFVGAASNQAVLAANSDTLPVLINARKVANLQRPSPLEADLAQLGIHVDSASAVIDDGMLDNVHCVMTAKTHLNFLADWIDLHAATLSPGDLLLELGDYLWNYAPFAWALLVITDLLRRHNEYEP